MASILLHTHRNSVLKFAATSVIAAILPLTLVTKQLVGAAAPTAAMAPSSTVAMAGPKRAQSEAFVENRGQWDAQAQFLARSPGVDSWVTERGVVYDFHRFVPIPDAKKAPMDRFELPNGRRQGHVVRMEFVGGKPSPSQGEGLLEGRYNYFIGNDQSRWASNVPRYSEVRSERVYDGIEARWYFDQGRPRYDLIVAPGADPGKIQMRFEGARGVSADGNTLRLSTSLGDVEHRGLFAYQKVDGATRQVPCRFVVRGATASFHFGDYDRSKPLIVDPLVWSTFHGGAATDYAPAVAVSGQVVVAGYTASADFPTTLGAYDQTYNGGGLDACVSRLSVDGSSLLSSTFLGGAAGDIATSVALDASGSAVVAGYTYSKDFPTTEKAYDKTHNGQTDAFVSRLSQDGSSITSSTLIGGLQNEILQSVALDGSGNAVVVGHTDSNDFPATSGGYDQTFNGYNDAFVSKLSPDGSNLLYSTFLGAAEVDEAYSVVLDASGNAVVVGQTQSTGFPTTGGAYDRTQNGSDDAFICKLSADGSSLLYSTFLGGAGDDVDPSVALDASGNAVVVGWTISADFPTTAGAYDQTFNGSVDAFVARLSANGSSLLSSTFIGSTGFDGATSVSLDAQGNTLVAGHTYSNDFPTTAGAHDQTHNGGRDAFIFKLPADLSNLYYSTFLGGAVDDYAMSIASTAVGAVVTGHTQSANFPSTAGAYDPSLSGSTNAFVSHVSMVPRLKSLSVPKNTFVGGFSVPATVAVDLAPITGDVLVPLSTDTPGKVFVSQTKIKAGKTTKSFGVRTETVKVDTPVQITATLGGVSKTISFTLKPGGLLTLKLNPTAISSLESGTGTVTLSAPAPEQGRLVYLDSNNAALLHVPVSVGVPQGQLNAVFPTFAGFVASSTNVTVRARLGTTVKTANLALNP